MTKHALIALWIAAGAASAQSTAGLGAFEPPTTYQISVGANSHLIPMGYAGGLRTAVALDVSAHHALAGVMTLRVDGWVIDRTSIDAGQYWYGGRYDQATGRYFIWEPRDAWLFAAAISGSFPIHIAPHLTVGPSVGLGIVPIAQGRFREVATGPDGSSSGGATSRTAQGFLVTAGLALRWRHLVVEQHILQISGADRALANGENSPFTVGWRF